MVKTGLIASAAITAVFIASAMPVRAAEDDLPIRDFSAAASGLKLRGSVTGDSGSGSESAGTTSAVKPSADNTATTNGVQTTNATHQSAKPREPAATGTNKSSAAATAAPRSIPELPSGKPTDRTHRLIRTTAAATTGTAAKQDRPRARNIRTRPLQDYVSGECRKPNALGVSRVVEIDTTGGPEYGKVQYKGDDAMFLRDREVVLTFDDGPLRRHTKQVLAELERHCTLATFFAVGRQAVADADMLRKVHSAGHTIAHHTWSHLNQNKHSFPRTVAEFELGLSAVTKAIGAPTAPFFRFPYLADPRKMRAYLSQRNFGIFSIDIDSYDFRTRSGDTMRRNTMSQLKRRGRGIILFHDIQTSTARGIGSVLDALHSGGYKIVHMVAKHEADTLPEYDAEAAVLLESRKYTRRARPLKTSFKFDGKAVPTERLPVRSEVRTTSATNGSSSVSNSTAAPRRRPAAAQRANPTSAPASTGMPAWKQRVLGISND